MEELIQELSKVNNKEVKFTVHYDADDCVNILEGDEIDKISALADSVLIESAHVSITKRKRMREEGFAIYAIESDSFGWLVGGIKTNHGVISFG